jgi:hypothetical protein
MKKHLTLFLITFSIATQQIKAQLDMAFISNFSATSGNSINRLNWTVTNNQGANRFYVERSTNGKDFETIGVLMATQKLGNESYIYSDTTTNPDKIMYRLNILSKNQHSFYSKIVIIQSKIALDYNIKIMGNPVTDKLFFNYTSKNSQQADIKVYTLCGIPVLDQKINTIKGNNFITIPLNSKLAPGMYVIEINNGILCLTKAFVKQ